MKFIKLAFIVILGVLAIVLWWFFGNVLFLSILNVQIWIGWIFVFLVTNGLIGLSFLLFILNIPSWVSTEYHRYRWSVKKIDYWRTDFPAWLKTRKVINLGVVGFYVIFWLFFAPEAIDRMLNF
jgi:hypothetical protein